MNDFWSLRPILCHFKLNGLHKGFLHNLLQFLLAVKFCMLFFKRPFEYCIARMLSGDFSALDFFEKRKTLKTLTYTTVMFTSAKYDGWSELQTVFFDMVGREYLAYLNRPIAIHHFMYKSLCFQQCQGQFIYGIVRTGRRCRRHRLCSMGNNSKANAISPLLTGINCISCSSKFASVFDSETNFFWLMH